MKGKRVKQVHREPTVGMSYSSRMLLLKPHITINLKDISKHLERPL